jgi:hypothetical protein
MNKSLSNYENQYGINTEEIENYGTYFNKIRYLETGLFYCGKNNGWISIENKDNGYSILLTNEKNSHNRAYQTFSAMAANFYQEKVLYISKSIINLHLVSEEDKKKKVVLFLIDRVDKAIDLTHVKKSSNYEEFTFLPVFRNIVSFFYKTLFSFLIIILNILYVKGYPTLYKNLKNYFLK